ncbi:hypothetical protein BGZ98_002896 [Dissophora globulifera]|nr:hypothetical protein BGZ98_002896 [Dissophora globulifera]
MHDFKSGQSDVDGIEHDPLPPAVDFSDFHPSARYQFRGLARRAISYHRRQWITSACCLVIWPIILGVACLVIGLLTSSERSNAYHGLIGFCENGVDPQTNPTFEIGSSQAPPGGQKLFAAWYPKTFENDGYQDSVQPCVRWFGQSYPSKMPYENVSAVAASEPDSFYTPGPTTGWFDLRNLKDAWNEKLSQSGDYNQRQPGMWTVKSVNQTVYYTTANAQIAQLLGAAPNVTHSFSSKSWPPADASITWNTSAPGVAPGSGLLGAIPVRYATNIASVTTIGPDGEYNYSSITNFTAQAFLPLQDQAAMDKTILDMVTSMNTRDIFDTLTYLPFGGVDFEAIDVGAQPKLKMTMQFGQAPDSVAYLVTTAGLRQMVMMTQMTNAIVKTKYAGQYIISQGLRALPYEWDSSRLKSYMLNQLSANLFPFGLSFLLPTFVSILVQEKEDRHRMMMAMNGLKPVSYYLAHYVEFMTMQIILSLFFCLTCVAISSQFILKTSPSLIVVLFLIWAHVQTTLAFVIAALFSKTRRASLIVYFFVAITCIMASVSDQLFQDGVPFGWFIHPSFAFFNILTVAITRSGMVNGLYPLAWVDFGAGSTLFKSLMLMVGESFAFIILTFYIDAVAPSEYGVQKPWHFPVTAFFQKRANPSLRDPESQQPVSRSSSSHGDEDMLEGADADVYTERDRVRTHYDPAKTPLIIQNLYHRYPGKVEPALRGMSFGVETNTVLGLLGPNGAGKSTMIHLLTGLYSPTSGTAHVAGANIRTEMSTVHAKIGVCPQHDILWGDLTVADHLLFYSRLRGIPPSLEQQAVTYAIASVSLTKFRDRQVKGLSGGEKRRVSIAIALLGDNSVIFLDEPSTGLDPAVRRVIWDIINRVKVNRTVVLTTHSMEEADILSDKIAIMTLGRLRCIGTSLHLKELYGSGFRLNISSKPGRLQEACESVEKILKDYQFRRIDKFTNATTFEFDLDQQYQHGSGRGQLSEIFACLSQPGRFPAIEDWGVSQTTLEDVFIKIVTEGDSALAMPSVVSP